MTEYDERHSGVVSQVNDVLDGTVARGDGSPAGAGVASDAIDETVRREADGLDNDLADLSARQERIASQPFHDEDMRLLEIIGRASPSRATYDQCLRWALAEYFTTHYVAPGPGVDVQVRLAQDLLKVTNDIITRHNAVAMAEMLDVVMAERHLAAPDKDACREASKRIVEYPVSTTLSPHQVAELLIRLHDVVRIVTPSDPQGLRAPLLGVYCHGGISRGLYETNEAVILALVTCYAWDAKNPFLEQTMGHLRRTAPLRMQNDNIDLVPVNNGVFDVAKGVLRPFSPNVVFLSKTHVDYVADAPNPVIDMGGGRTWDVDTWIHDLSDSDAVNDLMWQVITAVVRPQVPWHKAVWLVNPHGANGKGTFLQLLKSLCGPQNVAWTTIPLKRFSERFGLESLVGKSAVFNDESSSDAYLPEVEELKAFITQDAIDITRKHRDSISYTPKAILVQCTNDPPRTRDKTGSWLRRLIMVPFTKRFNVTGEITAIREDYIHRPEVLRYVLCKALAMRCYRFDEPPESRLMLEGYRRDNDVVLDFWDAVRDELAWDLVPWSFLYDLFKAWNRDANPGSQLGVGKTRFINRVTNIVDEDEGPDSPWVALHRRTRRPGTLMATPEHLIFRYRDDPDMRRWVNPRYRSSADINKMTVIDLNQLPVRVDGLIRRTVLEADEARRGVNGGMPGE